MWTELYENHMKLVMLFIYTEFHEKWNCINMDILGSNTHDIILILGFF